MSTEDGLSQNSVFSITQDTSGFMWFGTDYGLNRFDGYKFVNYFNDPEDSTSLSNNSVMALHSSNSGGIWVGTNGGGLNYFDPLTQTFLVYLNRPDTPTSLSNNHVTAVLEASSGKVWVGTENGLNLFEPESQRFTRYFKSDQIPDDHITCLHEYPAGTIWIGTKSGYLVKYDTFEDSFTSVKPDIFKPNQDENNIITDISSDGKGFLWLSMFLDGVYSYQIDSDILNRFGMAYTDPDMVSVYAPFAIEADPHGNIWIGSVEGLTNLNPISETYEFFKSESHNQFSIGGNVIKSLFIDNQKTLWVGTRNNGISRYSRSIDKFARYQHSDKDLQSLSKNTVYGFTEDHSGNIWVGTSGGGLNKINADGKSFTRFIWDTSTPEIWSHNFIMKLICDSQNYIWISTWESGLFGFDPKTGRFENFHNNPKDSTSLSGNRIHSILEDSRGDIWIGTSEKGLNLFDKKSGTFKRFKHDPADSLSISGNSIYSIKEDSQGNIWLGTSNAGLNRYHPQTQNFLHYSFKPRKTSIDLSDDIRCLQIDHAGIIWVGTYGGGLIRFDPVAEDFTQYKVKDGLPSNVIKGILEDDSGNLWISTNKGLCKFDPLRKVFSNYTIENGLQGDEFRYESCFKSSTGAMYFGGTNGFNVFRPEEIANSTFQAPVVLTEVQINYESIGRAGRRGKSPVSQAAPHLLQDLQLSYADKVLAFEFAALDYSAPNKNQYAYRLAGFDNTWIHAGNQHQVTYTNLDPGSYTLEVKGSNSDGFWSDKTIELPITISPPFWETIWFRILVFLTISMLVITVYKIRMNKLRTFEQRKAKEKEVLLQLEYQQRALVTKSMDLIEKQEFMEEILDQIKALSLVSEAERKAKTRVLVNKLTTLISFNHVWEEFEKWFTEIHSDYISNLRIEHPNLTSREIKLCALLRLNLMSKEIANLMNIEPASVDIQRYRIRKKNGAG
ncbi:MAG: hypothetical protein H8E18_15895 [FCB group bacterium]|nr:hypothetical protein [FCB group bacterium]